MYMLVSQVKSSQNILLQFTIDVHWWIIKPFCPSQLKWGHLRDIDFIAVQQVGKSAKTWHSNNYIITWQNNVKESCLHKADNTMALLSAGVLQYNTMYETDDKQSSYIIITSAIKMYHSELRIAWFPSMTVVLYPLGNSFNIVSKGGWSWHIQK